jgi:Holliday junction resolvase RusA-like endonuclease
MSRFTHDQLTEILSRKGYSNPLVAAGVHYPQPQRPSGEEPLAPDPAEEAGSGRTVVLITRWSPKRLDCDNLYGGVKALVDALRYSGKISDDDERSILLLVQQRTCKKEDQGTEILIIS